LIVEVGLRPNEPVDYLVTAQASGGLPVRRKHIQRSGATSPSQHVTGPVSATDTFLADGTGEVNQTLILAAPGGRKHTRSHQVQGTS
jgi:hypothetical protein